MALHIRPTRLLRLAFFTGLLLCTSMAAGAQDICFEHIDISRGLSQNTVQAIIQDRDGFMWFGTKDGLNRFDGRHFKIFRHIHGADEGLGSNQIRCLAQNRSGDIWIGTGSGLYIYNHSVGTISCKPITDADGKDFRGTILTIKCGPDGSMWVSAEHLGIYRMKADETELHPVLKSASPIRTMEIDRSSGDIWFAWSGGGLFCTEDGFATYNPYLLDDGSRIFPEDIISSILISEFGKIYIGLESNGVAELDRSMRKLRRLGDKNEHPFVRNIMQYSPEELWIGTESGVFIYDIPSRSMRHLVYSRSDRWSLSDNAVHSIFKDRDSGIWIGTFFGGLNYLPHRTPNFRKFYNNGTPGCFSGRRVRRLCPDGHGKIWVASEDAGLFLFNPEDGKFTHIPQSSDFSNIQTLMFDGDELWMGTFSKGIKVLDTKTSHWRSYQFVKEPGPRLFSNNIFAMEKSADGRIYIGTMHGLQFYDRKIDGFGYVPEINGGKMVNDIHEDSDGNLWVGTLSNGLYLRRSGSGKWEQFTSDASDGSSLPGNCVTGIFEDSGGELWIAVYGYGICRYNSEKGDFTTINSMNGLPGDIVCQIAEDSSGYLWLSCGNGLALVNPDTFETEKIFTVDDGLLSNQFNGNSFCTDDRGNMYFGCIEGIICFNPMKLHRKTSGGKSPEICITEFSISGTDGAAQSSRELSDNESLSLKHDQNTFSMQLSSLTFSENNRMAFKMQGYDSDWRDYDGGTITYTNMLPGDYVFCAKLKDYPDTVMDVGITIRPPWWASVPALACYILLAAIMLGLAVYLIYKQQADKRDKYIKAFEIAKEREVYDTKITFFTNVTHEIRTPLTLIKGPLDNILSKGSTDPALNRDLNIMKRNTDRLLSLVNQLLDFQKIEKANIQLELSCENIPELLEDVIGRFADAMGYKGRTCLLDIADRDIFAMVNKESITKIISNLLTNAMKYSASQIGVSLRKDGADFKLTVSNDGPVVPPDKRDAIFTQFYRLSSANEQSGTGIGLYLSRSLAELQHGTLGMTDNPDANEFVLSIPLSGDAAAGASETDETPETDISPAADGRIESGDGSGPDNTLVLIVEDDVEMCTFIRDSLSGKWKTAVAYNGKEALEILERENIDIIVSDVMMPVMDGMELCRIVRSDIRFTHIPLALLTAKTTLEAKIEGMNIGADAYIEKPFSIPYLESVIANLLKTRQQLREAFLKNPLSTLSSVDISAGDSKFIARLQDVMNENLGNPKFRMDDIAEMMNMSRSNFYRKIKGVLDISPNDYLKLERLKRAAKLLSEKDLSISEVCYMVGFSSPSYFAKCFHAQFGIYPKNFSAGLQKTDKHGVSME